MKRALLSTAAGLFLFVSGEARADANSDIAEKMVRLLERIATLVDTNKSDCNAMGDKLNAVIDENSAFIADAKARSGAMSQAERDAIQARYGARLQAATMKMMPGIRACATNPKVNAAIKRVQ
jgi:hypothetical protein